MTTITFKSRHRFGLAPVHGTIAIRHGLVDIADLITDSGVQLAGTLIVRDVARPVSLAILGVRR